MRLPYPVLVWRAASLQAPPVPIHKTRIGVEHAAFMGALIDFTGYLAHWPTTEAIGKAGALVACLALYLEHAEEKRFTRREETAAPKARRRR